MMTVVVTVVRAMILMMIFPKIVGSFLNSIFSGITDLLEKLWFRKLKKICSSDSKSVATAVAIILRGSGLMALIRGRFFS